MRLLYLKPEEIQKLLDGMEKDINAIKKTAMSLTWYMRGGVSYEDVLIMSHEERKVISELVDQNLETTKKTQMPFF